MDLNGRSEFQQSDADVREVFRTALSRREHLGGRTFQRKELEKQGVVLDVSSWTLIQLYALNL